MRAALACLLSILLPLSAMSAPSEISFARLAQLVITPAELQGSFRQQKYLATLDTSLTSSGHFSLLRGESIHWLTVEPIENELVITPSGLSSRQGDDELLRLDAGSNPVVGVMGEIMFALLSAEWQRLARYFELSGEIDGQQWHAQLQPRDVVIAQLFERVELRGEELLQVIVLHESSGDITTIHLDFARE